MPCCRPRACLASCGSIVSVDGFLIEELDAQGKRTVTHDRVGVRKANTDFEYLTCTFRVRQDTVKVRFCLVSRIGCIWQQGAAVYDECVLAASSQ